MAVIAILRAQRVPPHAYFVGSAVFHYLGPAFAVLLFARVESLGVAWLRNARHGRRQAAKIAAAEAMRSQATPSASTRTKRRTANAGPR